MKKLIVSLILATITMSAFAAELTNSLRIVLPESSDKTSVRYCSDMWAAHGTNPSGFDSSNLGDPWLAGTTKSPKQQLKRLTFIGQQIFNNNDFIEKVEVKYFDDFTSADKYELSPAQVHLRFKAQTTYNNIPVSDYYYMFAGYLIYSYFVSPSNVSEVSKTLKELYAKNPDSSTMFPPVMNNVFTTDAPSNKQTMFGCFTRVNTSKQDLKSMDAYGFDFNMFALRVSEFKEFNPKTAKNLWKTLKFKDVHAEALTYIEQKAANK